MDHVEKVKGLRVLMYSAHMAVIKSMKWFSKTKLYNLGGGKKTLITFTRKPWEDSLKQNYIHANRFTIPEWILSADCLMMHSFIYLACDV